MAAGFPDTPVTLLARLEERENGLPNQNAWASFFDLYHGPIRLAVLASFHRCGWHDVSRELLEDTIADVVVSFFKADFAYDPQKGKFRNYLRQLAAWRVMDRLGKSSGREAKAFAAMDPEAGEEATPHPLYPEPSEDLLRQERAEYRASLLATLLEDVRHRVSPQTFLMFEKTKLQGESPEEVAKYFKVKRNVVDNAVFRVLAKLKELASQPEYQKEYLE